MQITSKNNSLVKDLASLKTAKGRKLKGQYLVEGYKLSRDAVKFNQPIEFFVINQTAKNKNLHTFIPASSYTVIELSDDVFSKISSDVSPQGIAAVIKINKLQNTPQENFSILLDGVSDPGNLGAIIRTAAACDIYNIYLKDCADPYNPKCVKASMGAIFSVNLVIVNADFESIINLPIISADLKGESVFSFSPPKKFCLAIGSEANGLSEVVKNKTFRFINIPMTNKVESLNAAVAASVIIYQLKFNSEVL